MSNEHLKATLRVLWRGTEIGLLTDYRPDMAYLEGLWIPNGTEVAGQFTCLARSFMGLEVFKDSSKGTEIFLLENPEQVAVKAIVVSLEEDRLFVRRVLFG